MPVSKRGRGRPYIGPKVQTQVPESVKQRIKKEANKRGIREADVVRELILSALAAT